MFENAQAKKTRHKVMLRIELDDGTERLMSLFVAPGTRVSDTLNDNRLFLPFESADGSVEIIRKESIRRIMPMESAVRPSRNPYDVLGVSERATDAEIRAAYHKAIAPVHPDNIAAMNLPPDFAELANRIAAQINEAHAKIRKQRSNVAFSVDAAVP